MTGERAFLLLAAAMTLSAFAQYAVLINLVPLLTSRGMSATEAAWALGLGGAGQVAGRLCYPALFLALAGTSVISGALVIGTGTGARPQDQAGGQTGEQNPASDRLA